MNYDILNCKFSKKLNILYVIMVPLTLDISGANSNNDIRSKLLFDKNKLEPTVISKKLKGNFDS